MRYLLILLCTLFWSVPSAMAQVSIGIGLPGVSIGINLPLFPELVQVPGYPVYYAPRLNSNFFFYDGMYWVYEQDNWYASSWYNGPWGLIGPEVVPLYVLRIPVSYYRDPPGYFRGWRADAPPRWGEHWGNQWAQRRGGWDKWNRSSAPAPAPLPVYQRQYSGDRYPKLEQQHALRSQNYRYQPRDTVVRQHYKEQAVQKAPAPSQRGQQGAPQERRQQDGQRSSAPPPVQQSAPAVQRAQPPQGRGEDERRSAPTQAPPQQRGPAVPDKAQRPQAQPPQGAVQREQPAPRSGAEKAGPGKGTSPAPRQGQEQGQGQEKEREKGEERGQGRNK